MQHVVAKVCNALHTVLLSGMCCVDVLAVYATIAQDSFCGHWSFTVCYSCSGGWTQWYCVVCCRVQCKGHEGSAAHYWWCKSNVHVIKVVASQERQCGKNLPQLE